MSAIRIYAIIGALIAVASGAFIKAAAAAPVGDAISVRLRAAVEAFVRENAPGDLDAVRIPELGAFDIPGVDPTTVDIELSANRREKFVGLIPITAQLSVNGIPIKRSVVTARAEKWIDVLVAARALPRGARIGELDLRVEQRDMSKLASGAVIDPRQAIGMQASRAIPAGRLLLGSMLAAIPIIKRGDLVAIRYESGLLRIDGRGVSRNDAMVGDRIRVVTESRREVTGWISEDRVVHVGF